MERPSHTSVVPPTFNMAPTSGEDAASAKSDRHDQVEGSPHTKPGQVEVETEQTYAFEESRKLGVTGAVFLILNKMIGTGSNWHRLVR
jgi:hypothetical protein